MSLFSLQVNELSLENLMDVIYPYERALILSLYMLTNKMWQGAWCQMNNQANVFKLLKSSSQCHAQWSTVSRKPLCIWSR